MSFAFVFESPEAKSVTSWPASTRPSARSDTIHSIPPYPDGGTGNHTGLTIATRSGSALIAAAPVFGRVDRSFQTAARAEPARPDRDTATAVSSRRHSDLAVVEPDLPLVVEGAHTRQSEGSGPRRELGRCNGLERVLHAVRHEPEQELKQQHGRTGRPGLRSGRRRIGDGEPSLGPRQTGEDLRQLVIEMPRRRKHLANDAVRLGPTAGARKTPSDQRVVMGPDRSVVVRERVEATIARRHRPYAPARPEPVSHELVDDRVDALGGDDPAPQQVPDVGAERVDRILLPVERED